MQLRGNTSRAFWKAGGAELHRGSRAVLVLVRGSCRAGTGAPPPFCARSSGSDGFHAYGKRCRAPTTTSTPTPSQSVSSTSSFATTATATTNTTDAVAKTSRVRGWNVCRCRYVLNYFSSGTEGEFGRGPPPPTLIPAPLMDEAVSLEGQALCMGLTVVY